MGLIYRRNPVLLLGTGSKVLFREPLERECVRGAINPRSGYDLGSIARMDPFRKSKVSSFFETVRANTRVVRLFWSARLDLRRCDRVGRLVW